MVSKSGTHVLHKYSNSDRVFYVIVYIIMSLVLVVTLYPLYFTVIASISDPTYVTTGQTFLFPRDIQFHGYRRVFLYPYIWSSYRNTIYYTVVGTAIGLVCNVTGGFVFSRKGLKGSRICMLAILFTMYFYGGLIPSYFNIRNLGLLNTPWALWLPSAISGFNLILARTFMQTSIPDELNEAAVMDGCSPIRYFIRVIIPLSKPLIAVLALFLVVGYWNSFFEAMIYIKDRNMYPLQLILREILIEAQISVADLANFDPTRIKSMQDLAESLKYALIIVSTVPILIIYPFFQRFFVKGVMIGSVKG